MKAVALEFLVGDDFEDPWTLLEGEEVLVDLAVAGMWTARSDEESIGEADVQVQRRLNTSW